ncbi:MAG: hypothetical protein JNL02_12425 [Saprospiraceae bacterium]|nr:hypothetical protein [Saprospiraceae bacterium]
MKNKVVIWGANAQDEKVLIALELQAATNKVLLYTFPEAVATEEFVEQMMNQWRNGNEVDFPEGYATLERELSVTENLLPEDLKVDRTDIIQRAQTEWHFAILSAKLHAAYQQELAEFKEKIEALGAYDHNLWDNLRSFWNKVQDQARDRNLFREHADNLRDNINALFDVLKQMRSRVQDEFMTVSQKVFDDFSKSLEDVEARIAAGGNKLNSVFEDLKQMQRKYRDAKMSNEHRNALWTRLDGAFKAAKARKFGASVNEGSIVERHERRLSGLMDAVRRMEDSIRRDEDELNFQQKKVAATEGQLEAQLRSAKIKMVEERIASKREKLAEMMQTRNDVQRQIDNAKNKEAKRQKMEAAKEAAKSEIAAEIKTKPTAGENEGAENKQPASDENLLDALGAVVGETLEDVVDTAKAVGSVLGEKAGELLEQLAEKADEVLETLSKKEEAKTEESTEETAEPTENTDSSETGETPVAEAAPKKGGRKKKEE